MSLFNYLRFPKFPPGKKPPPESNLDVFWDEALGGFVYETPEGVRHPFVDNSDVYEAIQAEEDRATAAEKISPYVAGFVNILATTTDPVLTATPNAIHQIATGSSGHFATIAFPSAAANPGAFMAFLILPSSTSANGYAKYNGEVFRHMRGMKVFVSDGSTWKVYFNSSALEDEQSVRGLRFRTRTTNSNKTVNGAVCTEGELASYNVFGVPQTTPGITLTLPDPVTGAAAYSYGSTVFIDTAGASVVFTMYGYAMLPNKLTMWQYTADGWKMIGGGTFAAVIDLANEITRATNAEQVNANAITAEVNRATTAEADKVDKTITLTASGLVTGGGNLSADRTLTVTESSDAEMQAGTSAVVVSTPRRLAAWWTYLKTQAQTFAANLTLAGTGNTAPNQTAASTGSLMTRLLVDARVGKKDPFNPPTGETFVDGVIVDDQCRLPAAAGYGNPAWYNASGGPAALEFPLGLSTAAVANSRVTYGSRFNPPSGGSLYHDILFDVFFDSLVHTMSGVGWSDQNLDSQWVLFGIYENAGVPATNFSWMVHNGSGPVIVNSGLAIPAFSSPDLLRIVISRGPGNDSCRADVWVIPFYPVPPTYVGSSAIGPSESAPRNVSIAIFNDRPRVQSMTLNNAAKTMYVGRFAVKHTS